MPPYRLLQRAGVAEPSVAQLVYPLMEAVVDNANPTKQHTKQYQVLISESVENEIDKIAGGAMPEFRDSFERWGAVSVRTANEASRDWSGDTLPWLVPCKGARLRLTAMGELKKPQRTSFGLPGKYEYQKILAKLQR